MAAGHAGDLATRYLVEAVQTATPAARLTMLYDRLELDIHRAGDAFDTGDLKVINDNLVHAQEILFILRVTLRGDVWDGAERLAPLYEFLTNELLGANLSKDRTRLAAAAEMIGELASAWRQAAANASADAPERDKEPAGGLA